jgi:O-antigen/teichoic acid export membrane protein
MYRRARNLYTSSGRDGTLVRTVVGSAGLRVAGMGLGFLVGLQLARALGPAGYGIYGIAMSLVSIAMIPTELGLSQLVTREAAIAEASADRSSIRSLLDWTFRFVLANTAVIAVAALAALLLMGSGMAGALRPALLWGMALLPLVAIASICSAALRGMHHVVEGQLFEMLLRPGLLSLGLFAIWISGDSHALTPTLAMELNVLAAIIGAGFVVRWLVPLLRGVPTHPQSHATRRRWLRSAIPLALGEGMRIVSGNLAILILGLLAPPAEVGLYRVAFGVYTAATLPSALLNVACSPMLASLHAEGKKAAIQRVNAWMALLLVLAAVATLVPFLVAGGTILSIAFGHDYAASNTILVVLLAGELATAFIGHPTVVLNMLHHEHAVTRFSLVALLINAVGSVCLIPIYGGIGAALGVAISQFMWRLLCSWHARRYLGLESSMLAWRKS